LKVSRFLLPVWSYNGLIFCELWGDPDIFINERISSKLCRRKKDMSSLDCENLEPIGTLQFEKSDFKVGEKR